MKFSLFILLIGLSFAVSSQVFSWKDENGMTHFGDRVPEKYKSESKNIEVKANVVEMVKYVKTKPETEQEERVKPQKVERFSSAEVCKSKWEKYNWSLKCFASCGTDKSKFSTASLGRKHKCGCVEISKPNCQV